MATRYGLRPGFSFFVLQPVVRAAPSGISIVRGWACGMTFTWSRGCVIVSRSPMRADPGLLRGFICTKMGPCHVVHILREAVVHVVFAVRVCDAQSEPGILHVFQHIVRRTLGFPCLSDGRAWHRLFINDATVSCDDVLVVGGVFGPCPVRRVSRTQSVRQCMRCQLSRSPKTFKQRIPHGY